MATIDSITVGSGSKVSIHFTLSLADGTVVDASDDNEPLQFEIGDGSLINGLEQILYGMKAGEKQTVSLEAREAFGFPDEDNIHTMKRSEFANDIELEVGHVIGFSTPSGEEIPGTIKEFNDAEVIVDFNHPLAGHDVIFDVEVLEIEPPTTH